MFSFHLINDKHLGVNTIIQQLDSKHYMNII